jgi:hypothetical protein
VRTNTIRSLVTRSLVTALNRKAQSMSRTLRSWPIILASLVLGGVFAACGAIPAAPAPTAVPPTATALLKPGDHIGDMVVTNQEPASGSEDFQCDMPSDSSTPTRTTIQCSDVPRGTTLNLSHGWVSATQQELENAWSAMQWQEFIDGQELDMPSFRGEDSEEGGRRGRGWQIWLVNLTSGKHSVRTVYHVTRAIKDSLDEKAVGDYELIHEFTVK